MVTGDSQAWMWTPAFDKWGSASGWKVIVLTKGSCQPWPDPQQEFVDGSTFPACATFQSKVTKYININASEYRHRRGTATRDPDVFDEHRVKCAT